MKDSELKDYLEFLPEEMISDAKEAFLTDAPVLKTNSAMSAAGTVGSQKNSKTAIWPGLRIFKYAAVIVLVVASLAAGIIIAIKFGKNRTPAEENNTVINGETPTPGNIFTPSFTEKTVTKKPDDPTDENRTDYMDNTATDDLLSTDTTAVSPEFTPVFTTGDNIFTEEVSAFITPYYTSDPAVTSSKTSSPFNPSVTATATDTTTATAYATATAAVTATVPPTATATTVLTVTSTVGSGTAEPTAPVNTESALATPLPIATAAQEYFAPDNAKSYEVKYDIQNADSYPVTVPTEVKTAGNKGYYTVRYETNITLIDPNNFNISYIQKGKFIIHQMYICDAVENGNSLALNTDSVYIALECTSAEDYNVLLYNINLLAGPSSAGAKCLNEILTGNLYYRFNSGKWETVIFAPIVINTLTINDAGGSKIIAGINCSLASNNSPQIDAYEFTYDNSVTLTYAKKDVRNMVTERFFKNGQLTRELSTSNNGNTVETVYDKEGVDKYVRKVEKSKETVTEFYSDRQDRLYEYIKIIDTSDSDKTVTTHKYLYYKGDIDDPENIFKGKEITEEDGKYLYQKKSFTYREDGKEIINISESVHKDSGKTVNTETVYAYWSSGNLSEKTVTTNDSEGFYRYNLYKFTESGKWIYSFEEMQPNGNYSEHFYYENGKTKIQRVFETTSSGTPVRRALYYDESGNVIKDVAIIAYIDGKFIEEE